MKRYLALIFLPVLFVILNTTEAVSADRQQLVASYKSGNYKDAFEGFEKLLTSSRSSYPEMTEDLGLAISSLSNLNRLSEFDSFLEKVIAAHPDKWQILAAAARQYTAATHHGSIVAGEFERGYHRGGQAKFVASFARDRVRALQLFKAALDRLAVSDRPSDRRAYSQVLLDFAGALRNTQGAWRLQYLTPLDELPDYEEYTYYYGGNESGAPVDSTGQPVFYKLPGSFQAAKSDGERYRWALFEAAKVEPSRNDEVWYGWAQFLDSQFAVRTIADDFKLFSGQGEEEADGGPLKESSVFALHTLQNDETIARLASGIKRFKLPDEFNPITIYRRLTENNSGYRQSALRALSQKYQDRRQFVRAAEILRELVKFSSSSSDQQALDQIVGAWGQFEAVKTQVAGQKASIDYRFRNGQSVELVAHRVKVDELIKDAIEYLKKDPRELDWNRVNLSNIGQRLIDRDASRYLGDREASWKIALKPRQNHWDARTTLETPLSKQGIYLLSATIAGGNTSKILLSINDTVILKKPLNQKAYYYLADAASGKPVANRTVNFFGYRTEHYNTTLSFGRTFRVLTKELSETTNRNGEIELDNSRLEANHQWIAYTKDSSGNTSYLGFSNLWYPSWYDSQYNQTKVYVITDRPVYRPGQAVKFKVWIRNAQYDDDGGVPLPAQNYTVQINNPRGEKVFEKSFVGDQFSGIDGEFELPNGATLGQYQVYLPNYGGSSFRVEEYKKPEFEVKVEAPSEPIQLGESFKAKILAKYYFGAPVTSGDVKVKVQRYNHSATWYPAAAWDWLYGTGYWWFSYNYPWFPNWEIWGCKRPVPWWWGHRADPPELVLQTEAKLGKDGSFEIPIDTALAKEVHGNQDHRYQITVEVTDQSRRTIYSSGEVLVARKPFKVFAWVDRGYYRAGDTVKASFKAHRLDGKPVAGKGALKLLKVEYSKGSDKPKETEVETWELDTDEQGQSELQLKASAAGQYRLAYTVEDKAGHSIEGGYLFTVYGDNFLSEKYRFNDIEIIPDKREYQPGEKARLLINTANSDSTVLLFLRPSNGVYLKPEVARLEGKSRVFEVEITKRDMPNFFVEAVTVAGGEVHSEIKELFVPPEKRVLNVDVTTDKSDYKPGEDVALSIKVTDINGAPYSGSTVVTVYDRALEYISGGSNVPEIKAFFWKWRRSHRLTSESNTGSYSYNLVPPGAHSMRPLGAFGAMIADQLSELDGNEFKERRQRKGDASNLGAPASVAAKSMSMEGGRMEVAAGADEEASPQEAQAEAGQMKEAEVRKEFADTAFWAANVITAADGTATLKFTAPDNLTAWSIRSWVMGSTTKVGEGKADITTSKKLLLRLQAPRFFVEKDEVVLSANIHNYLPQQKSILAKIELPGGNLELMDPAQKNITVESNGELRVDWRVKVLKEGEAAIRMSALSDEESDAMEMRFPVLVHGISKTESWSGAIRPSETSASINFKVPKERRVSESRLEIRYSPTLAGAMVDALPYLVDYPYGCTEQTLSRFLPSIIVQKLLKDMKLDLAAIREKRSNLNAQEIGDDIERAKQWKRYERNPVFDEEELSKMVRAGIERLLAMQVSDGGWGWFSGWNEASYVHTTAQVVRGLQVAESLGISFDRSALARGIEWLKHYESAELQKLKNAASKTKPYKSLADNMDALVLMVLSDAGSYNKEMAEFLYRDRNHLAVYSKAMIGLAFHKAGDQEKLSMILKNIGQYVVEDNENQTAYLNLGNSSYWWYWYGSEYEAHAYYLKLLAKADPKSEVSPRLVKYLLNNRKHSTYWNSTRDTAIVVEAFADYMRATDEHLPDLELEILIDKKSVKKVRITADNLFSFDNSLVLTGEEITTGAHSVEFKKSGKGALYFNAYLTNFTLEDYIKKAGLEIKVERKYYRLIEADKLEIAQGAHGQVVKELRDKYKREEIQNLATLKSGELVEIELIIESKNDYEYLIFEDMKPAGFEPIEVRSGYNGNEIGAYVEYRDEKVALFARTLARGRHSVSYRMKAEIPGKFSALPTKAYAMYAPELKANSDEIKLRVED
ncbi:MAG: alpha-2-macroglobulin [Deltaproteobacteria bacterium]|nr:alpha-2-macroglobulin [Deltaproteobacteria bacterium]